MTGSLHETAGPTPLTTGAFHERYPSALSAIVVATLAAAALLLVVAIDRIQTTLLEADAISQGQSWTAALLSTLESVDTVFDGGRLSDKDRETIALASRIGGLEKFIIFNAAGQAIAASDLRDIATINTSAYWTDAVLRGQVHAAIEQQDAGDQTLTVAETYVPVFASPENGRRVIGAFETYLDVTESARNYGRIGLYASIAGIALIAAAGTIAVAFARRTLAYRLERETMLADARHTAEAANRAKSSFLATVSHEIRTPMAGILATIELLEGAALNDDQKNMAAVVRRSASSLLGLLNQLLDQSKIEAGKLDIHNQPFALAGVLANTAALFGSAAKTKGLTLDYQIDDDLADVVVGDAARIEQILANLVGNALKFTETGGIKIAATGVEGHLERVRITVADTGIGVPAEALGRLFLPFEQADASTTRQFGGTGLGLTVSRQLAELMGGTLTATSEVERGSAFILELPLPATDAVVDVDPESDRVLAAGLVVLVAEDDPTLRWVIARQLERLGCRADVVEDGARALAALSDDPGAYDIIVTDWHMPVLDGLGLLRALAQADHAIAPVIMLTASGLPEEIETALKAGACEVLVKPVQLDAMAASLARAVGDGKAATQSGDPKAGTSSAVLDTHALEELAGGDVTMVDQLLADFADRLSADRRRLQDADDSSRRKIAHALRGAAGSVGAQSLSHACAALEHEGSELAWSAFEGAAAAVDRALAARLGHQPLSDGSDG
jgi:signal transduction histidine kinase/FixJ family two-component response regulator